MKGLKRLAFTAALVVLGSLALVACGGESGTGSASPTETAVTTGASSDWFAVKPEDGKFSLQMPEKPDETSTPMQTAAGDLTQHSYKVALADGQQFLATYVDYPAIPAGTEAEALKAGVDGIAATNTLVTQKDIDVQGHPGIEAEFQTADGANYFWLKTLIADNRQYQMIASTSTANKDKALDNARKFLDSFTVGQ